MPSANGGGAARPGRARPGLAQPTRERQERAREVAAVDRRDVGRAQRRQRLRVVPVQQVPLEALQALDRRERGVDPSRRARRVSMKPRSWAARVASRPMPMLVGDVRCATVGLGRLLEVVRRQAVVLRAHERRRSTARSCARRLRRNSRSSVARAATRRVGTGRLSAYAIERCGRPQREDGQRPRGRARRAERDDQDEAPTSAITGLAIISRTKSCAPICRQAGAARGARRRRLPLEQAALRDPEAHERHDDRVQPLVGLVGQEGELQRARGRRRSSRPRTRSRRNTRHGCCGRGPRDGFQRAADRAARPAAARMAAVQTAGLPGRAAQARSSRATVAGAIRLRRRLSRIFQREMSGQAIARQARAAGHPGEAATRGSASRRAPSGAGAARARARSTG